MKLVQHLIYRLSQGLKRNSRLYLLLTRMKYKRLSGDGNEDGQKKKKSVGLITPPPPPHKKNFARQHTFLVHLFLLLFFCAISTWNFQKLPSYTFYGGNVVCAPVHFFFHYRSFSPWWTLEFLIFSSAAIKFPCFSSIVIRSFVFYHSL